MSGIYFRIGFITLACAALPILGLVYINGVLTLPSGVNFPIGCAFAVIAWITGFLSIKNTLSPITQTLDSWEEVLRQREKGTESVGTASGIKELDHLLASLYRLMETSDRSEKELGKLVAKRTQHLTRSEEQTRISMAQLRAVLDGTPEAIALASDGGNFTLSNKALGKLIGTRPEDDLGHSEVRAFLCEMFGHHSTAVSAWDGEQFNENENLDMQWEVPELGGISLHAYSTKILPHEEGANGGRLWIFRDETDSRRQAQELQHNNRLEAVGRLAGGISHDFNNLLTALSGHLQLLRGRLGDSLNEEDRLALNTAQGAATRGAELVNQLVRFSRKEKTPTSPVAIHPVISRVKDLLSHTIDPKIAIICARGGEDLWALSNEGQLEQVLLNIAVNARDAIDGEGEIIMSCSKFRRSKRDNSKGECFVRLTISDDGVGMNPEVCERIFEPFFTTKDQGKGTGFGLATAYGIIQQQGGWIDVESTPGKGSSFEIYLPEMAKPTSDSQETESSGREPEMTLNRDLTVLVVDDEAAVRSVAEGGLKLAGIHVVTAAHGGEALKILASDGDRKIDLILMDMTMPELSGSETFERIRKSGNLVPVIFCSGQQLSLEGIEEASGWCPHGIIEKPYNVAGLGQLVREALPAGA